MYLSFSKSEDLPDYTCAERFLGGQRGILSRNACTQMEGSRDILNMDCEPGKIKMTGQRKPEEMLHISNSN